MRAVSPLFPPYIIIVKGESYCVVTAQPQENDESTQFPNTTTTGMWDFTQQNECRKMPITVENLSLKALNIELI